MNIEAIAKEIAEQLHHDGVIPDMDGYQGEAKRIVIEILKKHTEKS